jgi:hypothetical protein
LGKIEKYDKALGIWGGANAFKKTAGKVRWAFGEKDEIKKLQSYLNIHIGTINILLAEHGLEKMNLAFEKRELDQLHIRERLEHTKSLMQWIKDSVIAQTAAVQNTNYMLTKLFGMVSGELGSSLKSLGEMVAKVWYENHLMCPLWGHKLTWEIVVFQLNRFTASSSRLKDL